MQTCILLSKPRSGATVFRHALKSNPVVYDMGEIFNESKRRSFFQFTAKKIVKDLTWSLPSKSMQLFELYVDYCGTIAQREKPACEVVILDVKYDHLHFIHRPWQRFGAQPALYDLIRTNRWPVINLRRLSVLAAAISNKLAVRDGIYHLKTGTDRSDREPIELDPEATLKSCTAMLSESAGIARALEGYDNYLELTYETLFEVEGGQLSSAVLAKVAGFLGVPNKFDPSPALEKVVKGDPLQYVKNRNEIVAKVVPHLPTGASSPKVPVVNSQSG